ncbi:MAG: hypothetical protein HRT89_01330, partial [Lentisphaeria bacterium]|nr:hypothetical protein [Lentisphaeria bacterium]NQZ66687.1 hypothetical protein [Lentisphaeria bacterium]
IFCTGLRHLDGWLIKAFNERFSTDILKSKNTEISSLIDDKLLVMNDGQISATKKGLLLSNYIYRELI